MRLWSIDSKTPSRSQFEAAKSVYAQIGIGLTLVEVKAMGLEGDALKRFKKMEGICGRNPTTEYAELHHMAAGVPEIDVVVFYVSEIRENHTNQKLDGCSAHWPQRPSLTVTSRAMRWTLAHELGHSLMRDGSGIYATSSHHAVPKNNVMSIHVRSVGKNDLPVITAGQAHVMKRSPYCLEVGGRA